MNKPHVIIKLWPGKTEEQKQQLTDSIVKDMVSTMDCKESSISVAFEEVEPDEWAEEVFRPDILESEDKLYKKPGYNPFG